MHCAPEHCCGEAAIIFFIHLLPLVSHWLNQTSQDIPVNVLVVCLALGQEFCVHHAPHSKESYQHHLDFELVHPCFLRPWWRRTLPLKILAHSLWIILKDLWLVACDYSLQQVQFGFKLFLEVMTHLHMLLFLLLFQLRYYFCTDLPSFTRSFVMIVHTLLQFMSNSFAIILTVRQQSPCTFRRTSSIFSSACLWQASCTWGHLPHPPS